MRVLIALLLLFAVPLAVPVAAAGEDVPECEVRRGQILRPPTFWAHVSCTGEDGTLVDLTVGNLECVYGEVLGRPVECPIG